MTVSLKENEIGIINYLLLDSISGFDDVNDPTVNEMESLRKKLMMVLTKNNLKKVTRHLNSIAYEVQDI